MPALTVRVKPERAPELDCDAVAALFEEAAALADAELRLSQDEDDGHFTVVFDFLAPDLARLWELLQSRALDHPEVGDPLARAAVATCQGRRGWSDLRVLHHYDRSVPIDPPG